MKKEKGSKNEAPLNASLCKIESPLILEESWRRRLSIKKISKLETTFEENKDPLRESKQDE
jgi:hypothetical protein